MMKDILGALAAAHPHRQAIQGEEAGFTYKELFIIKEKVRKYFVEKLHLKKNDKVAFYLPNCTDFVCSFFAAAEIGAVTIPLNTNLKENELKYYINRCGIQAVITHAGLLARWGRIPFEREVPAFVLMEDMQLSAVKYLADSLTGRNYLSLDIGTEDSHVLYLCTSGSTGRPKIIPKTLTMLFAGAENLGAGLNITSRDRFLCVAPFFHANGFENCMFLPIIRGASLVLMKQFSPRRILDILEQEQISVFIGSPFIFSALCDCAERAYNFTSVRYCLSAGAPFPAKLKRRFYDTFGIKVREHYGASETGPISVQFKEIDETGAVGTLLQNVKVKIIDREGRKLAPGVAGEVLIRSNSMTGGYLDEPERNRQSFFEGYFRPGDVGMLDSDGDLHLVGRSKPTINVAGIKIDPVEIRNILLLHPKVKDAYISGVKNRRGIEIVRAIVVAHKDCTVKELVNFCKDRMAEFKIPRRIEFKEAIPVDVMGKVILPQ